MAATKRSAETKQIERFFHVDVVGILKNCFFFGILQKSWYLCKKMKGWQRKVAVVWAMSHEGNEGRELSADEL